MSYVNLMPDDYVARQRQKRANLLCAVLFSLVMIGVIAAAVASQQSYKWTRQVNDRVECAYAEAGNLIMQLQELESTRERMLKKADMTAQLLERVPRSYLLAAATNALPPGGSMTCFELSTRRHDTAVISNEAKTRYEAAARKKIKKSSRMDVTLTVTGLAGTDVEVARFIAEMARCPLMDTVDLVYSEQKEVNSVVMRKFQVVMRLKADADVRQVGGGDVASTRGQQAGNAGDSQ